MLVCLNIPWDLTRVGLIECRDNISVSLDEINYAEGLSISQMEAEEEWEGLGCESLAFMKSVSLKILLRSDFTFSYRRTMIPKITLHLINKI